LPAFFTKKPAWPPEIIAYDIKAENQKRKSMPDQGLKATGVEQKCFAEYPRRMVIVGNTLISLFYQTDSPRSDRGLATITPVNFLWAFRYAERVCLEITTAPFFEDA
jgi:hypothetical protein